MRIRFQIFVASVVFLAAGTATAQQKRGAKSENPFKCEKGKSVDYMECSANSCRFERMEGRIHFNRVVAPKLSGKCYTRATEVRKFLQNRLGPAVKICVDVRGKKDGKTYAEVYADGQNLNNAMLKHEYTVEYGKDPCPESAQQEEKKRASKSDNSTGESDEKVGSFRGYQWGTPKSSVLDEEGQPERTFDGNPMYTGSIAGIDVQYLFVFDDDDNLIEGKYAILDKELDDYQKLNDILREKYGEPNARNVRRRDDDETTGPREELKAGTLTYVDVWEREDRGMYISHSLGRKEGTLKHRIYYSSPDTVERREQRKREEAKEKL